MHQAPTLLDRLEYSVRPSVIVDKSEEQCEKLCLLWPHCHHQAINKSHIKPNCTAPGLMNKCWCTTASEQTMKVTMFTQRAHELQCSRRIKQLDRLGHHRQSMFKTTRLVRDDKDSRDTATTNHKTRYNNNNNNNNSRSSCHAGPCLLTQIKLLTLCLCLICNVSTCICSAPISVYGEYYHHPHDDDHHLVCFDLIYDDTIASTLT